MNLVPVPPLSVLAEVMEQLPRGAFLTVKHKNRVNTMTIGWALAGVAWSRPVFTVLVRPTRHTYKLIEQSPDFTVSVPLKGTLAKELAYCGSHSGGSVDKFAECGLGTLPVEGSLSPVVAIPGLHFACRTNLRAPMEPDRMDPALASIYPQKDYHTFYHGEIVGAWRAEA
ncbi:MAG: flavin reductase [Lentisphaeria bacterium]|jgi:flavin reductase (DIM6/NTAB) family NADH-FMN oxidoreductase RutF|nr:flavin reductase [Lentisphaeria bacterium]